MEGTTSTADNGDFGTAPSEICGYCGVALESDRCKVVLKSDKERSCVAGSRWAESRLEFARALSVEERFL